MHLPPDAQLLTDFITPQEEAELLATINQTTWSTELANRQVQHFGWRYGYLAREIAPTDYLGPLPKWLNDLGQRLVSAGAFQSLPDQVIANRYEPGQGIGDHVDCVPCFGESIASLTLGSGCIIKFKKIQPPKTRLDVFLSPRSVLIMKGQARYHWTHGISQSHTDRINSEHIQRGLRISLTFRNVHTKVHA